MTGQKEIKGRTGERECFCQYLSEHSLAVVFEGNH